MKKILLLAITFLILATSSVESASPRRSKKSTLAKPATSTSVKKRQLENRRAMKETSKKIEANKKLITKNLNTLNAVTADIEQLNKEIASMKGVINRLDSNIKGVTDSVEMLDNRLSSMSAKYASAVRKIHSRNRNSTSNLAFVFSANSVAEAYRRSRSMEQFSKWRKRKAEELNGLRSELEKRRGHLESLRKQRALQLAQLNDGLISLQHKKDESDRLVNTLKRESRQLKSILDTQKREADALESKLQQIIAEEARKAEEEKKAREAKESREANKDKEAREDNKVNKDKEVKQAAKAVDLKNVGTDFAAHRGNITFPVDGKYKIVKRFGRSKHPELKYVETNNPGIDIEASSGAAVRAAFDGRISDIFKLPGYNTIVMIRHGNYLTVYAGLGSILVKKGDTVRNGEVIGTLYADPDDGGRSILHFEIRNEKAKENPETWLNIS